VTCSAADLPPLRVLHVHHKAGFFGGVERVLYDTAKGLADRGWPQALMYDEGNVDEGYTGIFEQVGRDESLLERFRPDVALIHKLDDAERIAALAAAVPTVRMVHDHDLVCMRHHKYFPIGMRICELPAGIACYTHLCFIQRGSTLPITLKTLGPQRRLMAAHRNVKRFIPVSHWMGEELAMNGFDSDAIEVIHPIPSSLASVQPLPPSGEREILFVGQVIRGKGVDLMLQALAQVPPPWHATIIGAGHHLEACKSLARELGIASRVEFTGWVNHEQLEAYYARARLTVVPSRWPEPFGMVGIEAMARARPVAAFAAGGIPDWLDDGDTGLLAPAADVPALAAAISVLLNDEERSTSMGRKAAETVQKRFRHEFFLDRMSVVLSDAAK